MKTAAETQHAIRLVLLAMLPGLALHAGLMDAEVLLRLAILALICGTLDVILRRISQRPGGLSWLLTAVVLAVALPAQLPLALVALAGVVASVVGRYALHGAGFNPAMLAYAVIAVWMPATMYGAVDGYSGATLLSRMSDALRQQQTLGEVFGTAQIGVKSWLVSAAWLAGGAWLMRRRVLSWRIPLAMVLGLCACALLPWMLDADRHASPLLHLFSGSFVFAALFVATEPASAPRGSRACWLYGAGIGALIYLMRGWGDYADGIAFAILLMNFLAPALERYCAANRPAPTP